MKTGKIVVNTYVATVSFPIKAHMQEVDSWLRVIIKSKRAHYSCKNEEKCVPKKAEFLSVWLQLPCETEVVKKQWGRTLLSAKCCCLVWNCHQKLMQFWASPSEERKRNQFGSLATFWFGTFAMLFTSLRVLLLVGQESTEDEWYVVIEADKFERLLIPSHIACLCSLHM